MKHILPALAAGSPPHTRGRYVCSSILIQSSRFTPAYAGKIASGSGSQRTLWVHPRIRGEDLSIFVKKRLIVGSPPHTRGRSSLRLTGVRLERFTPAYAGKIAAGAPPGCQPWVHPRIRGEDVSALRRLALHLGSPPHTRGRWCSSAPRPGVCRFTPAYAGKMHQRRRWQSPRRVHPRIRGEDRCEGD